MRWREEGREGKGGERKRVWKCGRSGTNEGRSRWRKWRRGSGGTSIVVVVVVVVVEVVMKKKEEKGEREVWRVVGGERRGKREKGKKRKGEIRE